MINTLLAPELKDLIVKKDYETLKDFCSSIDPDIVAEFLAALSLDELLNVLVIVEPQRRVRLLEHFGMDIQKGLFISLKSPLPSTIISNMPASRRIDILKRLIAERQRILFPALRSFKQENISNLN